MNVYKYGKNLRCGYTTGACAAAAAKAAAAMLLTGSPLKSTKLMLKDSPVSFIIEEAEYGDGRAKCAVRKDAGADIDVTDGLLIYAEVRLPSAGAIAFDPDRTGSPTTAPDRGHEERISIRGGQGVGVVTKAGLDQPVGAAAINSGPRRMIKEAVLQVCDDMDYEGQLTVTISVPKGAEIAEKTFNPALGIKGGISILGSTGIVEPMSEPALIETIRAEMRVKWLELTTLKQEREREENTHFIDRDTIVMVPGNYGMKFAAEKLGATENQMIKCSNFIGEALDCACELGIPELVLAGNLGKLVKLAGGIFNTHSRNADCRMDILMRCAFEASSELLDAMRNDKSIDNEGSWFEEKNSAAAVCDLMAALNTCVTTDAALELLRSAAIPQAGGDACSYGDINAGKHSLADATMRIIADKAASHIKRRCGGAKGGMPRVRLIIISNAMEILAEKVVE